MFTLPSPNSGASTSGTAPLTPAGEYAATLRFVDEMDDATQVYDGKEKTYSRLRLTFLSDKRDANGRSYRISQVFPVSTNEKSRLMKFLADWLAEDFISFCEQETPLDELIGMRALLTVRHGKSPQNDKVYANIDSIRPLKNPGSGDPGAPVNGPDGPSATPSNSSSRVSIASLASTEYDDDPFEDGPG